MEQFKIKPYMKIIIYVVLGVFSATLLTKLATASFITRLSTTYLDAKRSTVIELSAASLAGSGAITLIPGDVGTPIANKMADLSTYSLIVLCAIFLEKYLVTITGYVTFRFIIPLCCLLLIGDMFIHHRFNLKMMAKKLIIFGIMIYAVIPASVGISNIIDHTYQSTINETIENAKDSANEVQQQSENQNLLEKFLQSIEGGANGLIKKFGNILNNLLEAFAVIIVTACIIPILVLLFMVWVTKMTFNLDIDMSPKQLPHHGHHHHFDD